MEMQCLRLHTDRTGRSVRKAQSGHENSAGEIMTPALKAGEHCVPFCPYVGVSTHSIHPAPPARLFLSVLFSALFRLVEVKMNSVPTPSVLMTLIFWLWALMISFTMESPRPVPLRSFPRRRRSCKNDPRSWTGFLSGCRCRNPLRRQILSGIFPSSRQ